MPSVCELKIALKAKGIKGITGLNKGQLEALLNKGGSSAPKKDKLYNKAEKFLNELNKEFTPAATKGESPKVAEKKITKKARIVKPLMITYKDQPLNKVEPKSARGSVKHSALPADKPPPKLKKPKQTEDERFDMLNTKTQSTKCLKLMKQAGLKTQADLRKYIITNHPDKIKNYDPNSKAAILYKELSNCSTAFKNIKYYLTEGLIKGFKGLPPEN